jgi:hypothetical protein
MATLKNAARQVARDCRKYDIPARRLTVAETRKAWTGFPAGPKGIVGHVDCTYAYPEDGGDHTDPGTGFPWDIFLPMVREFLAPEEEENDMAAITDADADKIANAVLNKRIGRSTETVGMDLQDDDAPAIESLGERLATVEGNQGRLEGKIDRVLALLDPPTPPTV